MRLSAREAFLNRKPLQTYKTSELEYFHVVNGADWKELIEAHPDIFESRASSGGIIYPKIDSGINWMQTYMESGHLGINKKTPLEHLYMESGSLYAYHPEKKIIVFYTYGWSDEAEMREAESDIVNFINEKY